MVEQIPSEAQRVVADRTRRTQILINFGSNAIKYGRRGGKATFLVSTSGDGFVRICVADDGIGIPKDKQDKLFPAFQCAGQEVGPIEGTGIGLTIAKRLAEVLRHQAGRKRRRESEVARTNKPPMHGLWAPLGPPVTWHLVGRRSWSAWPKRRERGLR